MDLLALATDFLTPDKLIGHVAYVLLIASMMMRTMKRLRILAIASGIVSIIYGGLILGDPVTVFWEAVFTAVNLVQLMLLEISNRRARFSEDEQRFVAAALKGVEPGKARRLMALAKHENFVEGDVLTREGEALDRLYFIVSGAARVDVGGAMVGVCGHDDILGEIGFMNDGAATATAIVTHSGRAMSFDRAILKAALAKDPELRNALEAAFSANLLRKLVSANRRTA